MFFTFHDVDVEKIIHDVMIKIFFYPIIFNRSISLKVMHILFTTSFCKMSKINGRRTYSRRLSRTCNVFLYAVEDVTYYSIAQGVRAGRRRPVLCPEHKFVICTSIDLKTGICVCCNNTECIAKEP